MKKYFLSLIAVVAMAIGTVSAQQVTVDVSQSRVIEPKQTVFVIPLTAEIIPLSTDRQEFLFNFDIKEDYGLTSMGQLTLDHVEELKKRALYLACKETDTDLIVGATFNVHGSDKSKDNKIQVEMRGYPASYKNWKTLNLTEEGYDWVTKVYPEIYNGRSDQKETEAIKAK
ncbi:MAG: hypothetical protein LBM07_06310 [Culturomica sp.]|jgi:hypothetical protein|nr:hypothetical protein [Culturomica sp.]